MYRHQLGQNEWKVILPKRVYAFHIVDLSDYQYCSSVLMFNIFAAVFNKAPALSEFSVFTSDRLTVPLTWSQWESVKSASERWCEHFAQEKKVDELRPVTKEVIQISKMICDFHLCSKWINKIFFFVQICSIFNGYKDLTFIGKLWKCYVLNLFWFNSCTSFNSSYSRFNLGFFQILII